MSKKYTLQEIVDRINKEVLGVPQYGFEEEKLWGAEFRNKYFFRDGEINGEPYSSQINQVLSGAAMSHTLDEIRSRLKHMVETDEG